MKARRALVLAALLSACSASGQLGALVGPTFHLNGRPGVELVGDDSLGFGGFADEAHVASSPSDVALLFGITASVGYDSERPHVPWSFQVGGGWTRLGRPGAPWGMTAMATGGIGNGPRAVFRVTLGPTYLRSQSGVKQYAPANGCGAVGDATRVFDQLVLVAELRDTTPLLGLLGGRHFAELSGNTTCH